MSPENMKARLQESYPDSHIEVIDLTGAGSNFQVVMTAEAFVGMSRVQQHQAVMGLFDPELKSGEIHALTIKTHTKTNS